MSTESAQPSAENLNGAEIDLELACTPTGSLEGQLVERVERRRLDLMTLHGVAREGARLYRALRAGKIGTKKYAVASSGLRRQAETLRDIAARELLERGQQAAARVVDGTGKPVEPPSLGDFYRTVRFITAPQAEVVDGEAQAAEPAP